MRKTYKTYKDSGIPWIGEIPEGWKIEIPRHLFSQRNSKGSNSLVLLSATQSQGMYPQYLIDGVVKVREDTDLRSFKTVCKNDFVISLRSFQGGFEISDYEGVCSPAYQVFYNKVSLYHPYFKLLFKSHGFISMLNSLVVGIREGKNIQYASFSNTPIPVPPILEQQAIASYLDEKCADIDAIISLQEEMIKELEAYKQSIITEAVTKGLDPNVPMKDSGIEWIGEIPEGWEVMKIKRVLKNKSEKGHPNETILSLYRDYGVIPKDSRDDNHNVTSEDTGSYKYVEIGNFVINKMKSWQGSMAVSSYSGIISPAYYVCMFTRNDIEKKYIHYLLRNESYKTEYLRLSTGMRIGQWDLNIESFLNIEMILPPLSEQQAIASYLDEKCADIDELISLRKKKIEELKEYKKSVIFEVVTGKIKVD